MKFSTTAILALATVAAAQSKTATGKPGKTAAPTATSKAAALTATSKAAATPTGKGGGGGNKGNGTSSGPAKATGKATATGSSPSHVATAGAPGMMLGASNAGGYVTIAGLGVAFALFM